MSNLFFFLQIRIEQETAEVEARKEIVAADEAVANEAAAKAQSIKDECENELMEALPALKEAEEALSINYHSCFFVFNNYDFLLKILSNQMNQLLLKL